MFTSHFSSCQPEPEASLIIPAFRLANMWSFSNLRAYLMPLAEKVLDDVDKIVLAQEFHIDSWVVPAYTRICQRSEPLNSKEAAKIGLEGVLLVSRIREEGHIYGASSQRNCIQGGCPMPLQPRFYCTQCGRYHDLNEIKLSDEAIAEKIRVWVQNGYNFAE